MTLTATPDGISTFAGFSGPGASTCTANALSCTITLTPDGTIAVTATFQRTSTPLDVKLAGTDSCRASVQGRTPIR